MSNYVINNLTKKLQDLSYDLGDLKSIKDLPDSNCQLSSIANELRISSDIESKINELTIFFKKVPKLESLFVLLRDEYIATFIISPDLNINTNIGDGQEDGINIEEESREILQREE